MSMRKTVLLFSLIAVLLLAGLCSCKQEVAPENTVEKEKNLDQSLIEAQTISGGTESITLNAGIHGLSIPKWNIQENGYHNIPDAVLSGTGTGVSKALKAGLKNPVQPEKAKNLIVMVCEGLTSELIESSAAKYGELILQSFPVTGTTKSNFKSSGGYTLLQTIVNDKYKGQTGIATYGNLSCSSMREMTTDCDSSESMETVCYMQFCAEAFTLKYAMGVGSFGEALDPFAPGSSEYHNEIYKNHSLKVDSFADAVGLYKKNVYSAYADAEIPLGKLYTMFENESALPSFRQETAYSIDWMQSIENTRNGFALLLSYSPSEALDEAGVKEFDEAVAVAVKFLLENPDTVILVCGCPTDGSVADVCFYGIGKNVSVKDTFSECVSSL